MINRLKQIWLDMRSSLWFVPTVMVASAIALALFLVEADGRVNHDWLVAYPRLFGAGADGSRGMLSAIAGSMITVAGLTFSLTLVAMAQASSQYTSRILRNFMRDRRNQFVLGYFVSVFAYCLIVLRAIRGGDEGRFIPSLAAIFGLALAIFSIGVLIFFIHHIASSIQASVIIKTAADETIAAVGRLFPKEIGEEAEQSEKEKLLAEIEDSDWRLVTAPRNGYIQNVDAQGLIRFAEENNCLLRMERGIGEFVVAGSPLVSVAADGKIDEKSVAADLQNLYSIGIHRTIEMDAAFGVRQLVDIALKALSPGVNDTTTALICVDYLTAILVELGRRSVESIYRAEDGKARIIARGATYALLVAQAYDQIRDAGANNVKVYLRLLDSIETAARQITVKSRIKTLGEQVDLIAAEADRTLKSDYNRQEVRKNIAETETILKSRGKTCDKQVTSTSSAANAGSG